MEAGVVDFRGAQAAVRSARKALDVAAGHLAYDSLTVDGHVYFVHAGAVFFTDGERAHWVDGELFGKPPDAYAWCHEVAAFLMGELGDLDGKRWHLGRAAKHWERAERTGECRWEPERRPRVDRRRLMPRSAYRLARAVDRGRRRPER